MMLIRGLTRQVPTFPRTHSLGCLHPRIMRNPPRSTTLKWSCYFSTSTRMYVGGPSKKKQKSSIQSLRRTGPNQQNETVEHILALLNKSNEAGNDQALERYLSCVTSTTIGEGIDLVKTLKCLKKSYNCKIVVPDEVLNITYQGKDLMVLSNGTLVGWGLSEETIVDNFEPLLRDMVSEPCEVESEEIDWIQSEASTTSSSNMGSGSSYMKGEILVIQGSNKDKILLDKAAFAIGLSRSTRLSVLEAALERHIQITRVNSEYMSKGKQITMTEADVLRLTGRLFLLRGKLNFYSELIETPDLYWSEPALEKIYESISRSLDISPRIAILNRKLDYATEEQHALLSVLNEKKSTRLEWIIILLIMVEVGFEMFHFYEHYRDQETRLQPL